LENGGGKRKKGEKRYGKGSEHCHHLKRSGFPLSGIQEKDEHKAILIAVLWKKTLNRRREHQVIFGVKGGL